MDYSMNSNGLYLPNDYKLFQRSDLYELTSRQMDQYKQWSEFIQWGRRNPVLFAEKIFGVEFMDYQRYVFMMSWNTPYVVWCCSRSSGKSILGSIFIMTKTLLIPNHTAYILCGVGSQSIELFTKIEKFVYNQIPSFRTLTDIYQNEVVKFSTFNNSQVFTLNGNFDNNRSFIF